MRRTALRRHTWLDRHTPMPRATKPMRRGNPALDLLRRQFHDAVFAMWGSRCVFCGLPGAGDAAHVLSKKLLGPLRYASPHLARPAHRSCHRAQHDGKLRFPDAVRVDAIRMHNALNPVVPLTETYGL